MGSMYEMGCFLSCSYLGLHRKKELKIKELRNGYSFKGSKYSDNYKNNIMDYVGRRIAYRTAYFPVSAQVSLVFVRFCCRKSDVIFILLVVIDALSWIHNR